VLDIASPFPVSCSSHPCRPHDGSPLCVRIVLRLQVSRAESDDDFDAEILKQMDRLFTDYDLDSVRRALGFTRVSVSS
jgi:hypothetical protein